ncbi:acetyl-CoA carboxylase biotin carboxyl carrier protein subunit [bacterium]|jgi:biotin carboxyl carrier protein|nr:acetyl-CoA carboxylase biotin carboxyl carrier protein subunit [bacterium]
MKKYELTIKGKKFDVEVKDFGGATAKVAVNGNEYDVDITYKGGEPVAFTPAAPRPAAARPAAAAAPVAAAPAAAPAGDVSGNNVVAPMPGLIMKVLVKVGDTVTAGQKVMTMEAMKMENDINSGTAGTVKAVLVKEGDNVKEHQPLVTIG